MANEEHVQILAQGTESWNRWIKQNPEVRPDFVGARLRGANLAGTNLVGANFSGADLRGASAIKANLYKAYFSRARLEEANLGAANLRWVVFTQVNMSHCDLSNAILGITTFGDVDLSEVRGLDRVIHQGPSTIGVDTIVRSRGRINEIFLRGAGVPEELVALTRAFASRPIEFHSCFISYAGEDLPFAERIHSDLQQQGVRCWFAPEDMKIGDPLRPAIDESIRLHDKLLLVLSEHSVASAWVEQEVETALERERRHGKTVLFPIRLDNAVLEIQTGWPALIRNTRHIGDFTRWRDHNAYQAAFERLLRDLKADGG